MTLVSYPRVVRTSTKSSIHWPSGPDRICSHMRGRTESVSTRRGPRRASCCRDCSPPRPSCSALRTSLCCPGLRGGRRGGLGRTGSRGARSRTAGRGLTTVEVEGARPAEPGGQRGDGRRRALAGLQGTGRVGERGPARRSRPPWGSAVRGAPGRLARRKGTTIVSNGTRRPRRRGRGRRSGPGPPRVDVSPTVGVAEGCRGETPGGPARGHPLS